MPPLFAFLFLFVILAQYPIATLSPEPRFTSYIGSHLFLFALMVLYYLKPQFKSLTSLVVLGIIARIALVGVPTHTTYDVSRYLWDGFVATSGLDPYSLSPNDLTLLAGSWPPPKDNLNYVTIYPPGAIGLFSFCSLFSPSMAWWCWKGIVTLASVSTLLLARRIFSDEHSNKLSLIALNPILILESGVGAHLDSIIGVLLLAAVLAYQSKRLNWLSALLALGTLIKFSPAICFSLLSGKQIFLRQWKPLMRSLSVFAFVISFAYALAFSVGWQAFGSLGVFFKQWSFGSPISFFSESWVDQERLNYIRLGAFLLFVIFLLQKRRTLVHLWQGALIALLVLSPVVFPWYLIPLCALAPFANTGFVLVWGLTLPLSYEVMAEYEKSGSWSPASWPMILVLAGWTLSLTLAARKKTLSLDSIKSAHSASDPNCP